MPSNSQKQTLRSLGERRIVNELIAPRFPLAEGHIIGIGDDCAVIPAQPLNHNLVMTIDPCPVPVVCLVEPLDFYHYGRMTILINVSDLSAMGARPLSIVISTVMPEDMFVVDYERFLEGLADASKEWSCPVVGGNIKDGSVFTATGSALGSVKRECLMRRKGAKPGDKICVIGEMGIFWAAVLTRLVPNLCLNESQNNILNKALYFPTAKMREGIALAETQRVTACMDSSDGVIACLQELALVNHVDIVLPATALKPHPTLSQVAKAAKIDVRKLMLSWGNWELIFTIPPEALPEVKQIIEHLGTPCTAIGEVCKGDGKVWMEENGQQALINNFASERFSATSMFTHGLNAYIDFLQNEPLLFKPQ